MDMQNIKLLAQDFASWGLSRVRRILSMTKKYGVLCSSMLYSTGTMG